LLAHTYTKHFIVVAQLTIAFPCAVSLQSFDFMLP